MAFASDDKTVKLWNI
ncbi:hypothetical protein [Nostoc sp.]